MTEKAGTLSELWEHQREDLEASWDMPAAAFHWEPRLGKSRIAIHTAQRLWLMKHINAGVIVAPNGVHLNWTREQLELYWSTVPGFDDRTMVVEWESKKANNVAFKKILAEALETDKFVWFAVNVEALGASHKLVNMKGRGPAGYLEQFVKAKKALLICDESHYLKNHRATRTKAVTKIRKHCPYRRNLTGTPDPQGPFDLFSQFRILDEDIFGKYITPFRQRYGEWQKMQYGRGPSHFELVEYKNLEELAEKIAPYTFTRRKKDCMDLPPRQMKEGSEILGIPRFFKMPDEDRKVYADLQADLLATFPDGARVTPTNALTQLLRLQQVTRGFVGAELPDGKTELRALSGKYPGADATIELLQDHPGKGIVWCHFVPDVGVLRDRLPEDETIVCDGSVDPRDRVELRREFNDPTSKKRWWVGTLSTGGIGVDLGVADLMIFYSHSYRLDHRLQGLERNYGSTQASSSLAVVDIIAADAVDYGVLNSLERKEDLAENLRRLLKQGAG